MSKKIFILKSQWWLAIGFVLYILPLTAAAVVAIDVYKLNDGSSNITLNPSSGNTVTISLVASEPAKFNTIAICAVSDSACSRSTAVKYFSQTDSYNTSVTKTWDGKKSSGEAVANGEYKIKVTLATEGASDTVAVELTSPAIVIDSSYTGGGSGGGGTDSGGTETDRASSSSSSQSTAVAKPVTTKKKGVTILAPELAVVNSPVGLEVPLDSEYATYKLSWAFGDGQSVRGRKATHIYRRPGTYVVVLSAKSKTTEETFRATIKIIPATVTTFCPQAGELKIKNTSGEEMNLGGWALVAGEDKFVLTKNTILLAGTELFFDSYDLGFEINKDKYLEFISPNGVMLASCGNKPLSAEEQKRLEKIIDIETEAVALAQSLPPVVKIGGAKPKIVPVAKEIKDNTLSTTTATSTVYVLTKPKADLETGLLRFLKSQVADLIN